MKKKRIVVTGLGVVSSIGIGWQAFWDSLLAGRSGIKPISYIDTSDYPTHVGGEVDNFDPLQFMDEATAKKLGRGSQFAIAATKMALEDAKLDGEQRQHLKMGVSLGTTMADIQNLESMNGAWVSKDPESIPSRFINRYPSYTMSTNIARHFNLQGPNFMIPTACAAGNYAICHASDMLRLGKAQIMVAGGIDPFSRIAFTGFSRLFALAPEKVQPFDKNRQGTIIGEGGGILVLETLESAQARNVNIYAEIIGHGFSCDGNHMTIPDGDGVVRVMKNALKDAEVEPEKVDYISAHGTGTPANDKTECGAIRNVFNARADNVPVSSIKSMLGHTMGAASALEAIACVLAIHEGKIPPTINHVENDPECQVDCVPNSSRNVEVKTALNNSFAFGGNNICMVLGQQD